MGGVEAVGQSGALHGGNPKGGSACPLAGDPHDINDGQYP
jgi:hypothetical protein